MPKIDATLTPSNHDEAAGMTHASSTTVFAISPNCRSATDLQYPELLLQRAWNFSSPIGKRPGTKGPNHDH